MTVEPEQVEAHAAQGYSLLDVARLLGVPAISGKNEGDGKAIDAFNQGAARWRENGSPTPPRATDVITQAVHSQLLSREMTRPKLKEVLGFRYDDLNLAIETLEKQFLIDHSEDAQGTNYYRASGTPSVVASQPQVVRVPVQEVDVAQPSGNNGHGELKSPDRDPCVDCGGPKSIGSGQRCKSCYEAKSAKNREEKLSARAPGKPDSRQGPTYKELNLQEVEDLMATEETMADAAKKLGMTTSQLSVRRQKDDAVAAAVDRGRRRYYDSLGDGEPEEEDEPQCNVCNDAIPTFEDTCIDCMTKEQQARMTNLVSGKPDLCGCGRDAKHIGRCQSITAETRNIIPPNIQLSESANKISTETTIAVQQTVSTETYSRVHPTTKPRAIKLAWSKDFEDDSPDGTRGLTMLYLVSMLHDGMDDDEKEAVWTLIQYLKRVEAAHESGQPSTVG